MVIINAYVNRGLWIAECRCRSAVALEPCGELPVATLEGIEWPKNRDVVVCINCGERSTVQMPVNRDEIEAQLVKRPIFNRNWSVEETVADLRLQNAAHHEELT